VLVKGVVDASELPNTVFGDYELKFSDQSIRDLWIAVHWATAKP
jgi:hypothetical protein